MDDFDHVPKPKEPPYKYSEKAPKKKCERRQLPAETCHFCDTYYASFPNAEERANASCRHRAKHKRPKTPEHFWELDFPDYTIPLQKYTPKPLWQNKYDNALEVDHRLFDCLYIQLIPYFKAEECTSIFRDLEREIVYLPRNMTFVAAKTFGGGSKMCKVPRRVAAHGDENVKYRFSGTTYRAQPWTPVTLFLRDTAYELTKTRYNFVLINRYRDGNDYVGSHKDDESELDPKSSIVSFSFGAERKFLFTRPHFPNYELTLPSGSALLMKPPTNAYWYHSLPPQKEIKDVRINLTFRKIDTSTQTRSIEG